MELFNNYYKLLLFSFLMILFFLSCESEKDKVVLREEVVSFSKFPEEKNIHFKDLSEYNMGIPKSMELLDSTLIIFNRSHNIESFYYNYSLKTQEFSRGYLRKGRGPNEAIGGFCSGTTSDGNSLWAYDLTLKKIVVTDKAQALEKQVPSFDSYPLETDFYQIELIDSSHFFANGKEDSEFKIQEINYSGKILNEFGQFHHIPDHMPTTALKDAYHSFMYLKPSRGKLAVSYLFTDVLEIYDLQNQFKSNAVKGPLGFDVDFKVASRRGYRYMKKIETTKKAFLDGAVTDKYIYLLYSGMSYANKNDWSYGKYIYVYDWDGNPVRKLNLDRRVSSLVVSKDDETVYAYNPDSGFIVKSEI